MNDLKLSIFVGRGYGQNFHKIRDMEIEPALEKLSGILREKYGMPLSIRVINRRRGRRSRSSMPLACLGGGPRRIINRRRDY
jgi:hypothetical protein